MPPGHIDLGQEKVAFFLTDFTLFTLYVTLTFAHNARSRAAFSYITPFSMNTLISPPSSWYFCRFICSLTFLQFNKVNAMETYFEGLNRNVQDTVTSVLLSYTTTGQGCLCLDTWVMFMGENHCYRPDRFSNMEHGHWRAEDT